MRRSIEWIDSWPGLRTLWFEGRPAGLAWATAFAIALNAALLSTFVWPRWLPEGFALGLWLAAACIWIGALIYQMRMGASQTTTQPSEASDSLFIQAQTEYLKGNWEQAEWLLRKRLTRHRRDIESRLALATLYRRQGKRPEARQQLQILGRLDQAAPWADEIAREWRFLDFQDADEHHESETTKQGESDPDSTVPPIPHKIGTTERRQAA